MMTQEQRRIIQRHSNTVPVDVGAVAREMGLEVYATRLNPGVSGVITRSSDTASGFVIYVEQSEPSFRQRFTAAHEIGHFVLHPLEHQDLQHSQTALTIFHDASEEAEANIFAAELLMPEFMFKPLSRRGSPSLSLIDNLAVAFSASAMAAAFQYIHYTNEQVALIVSNKDKILWTKRASGFWPRIQTNRIHPHSALGEHIAGKAGNTNKMVRSPVYAWLESFSNDAERDIMEDTRHIDYYDQYITLLWMKEDLNE